MVATPGTVSPPNAKTSRSIFFVLFFVTDIFEGDIVMDSRLRSWVTDQADKRDAIDDDFFLWPKSDDGFVRVPFKLSKEIREGIR